MLNGEMITFILLSKTAVANTKTEGLHPQFYNYFVSTMWLLIISLFVRKQIKGEIAFLQIWVLLSLAPIWHTPFEITKWMPWVTAQIPQYSILQCSCWSHLPGLFHLFISDSRASPGLLIRIQVSPLGFWTLLVIGSFSLAWWWMSPWAVLTGC